MPFDIIRLRGIAIVLGSLALALGSIGVTVRIIIRPLEAWILQHDNTFNVHVAESPDDRPLFIARLRQSGDFPQSQRLGLFFGSSTLAAGIAPSRINARFGNSWRWANVICTTSPYELNRGIQMLYSEIDLRPDAVAIVVNPGMIVATTDLREVQPWLFLRRLPSHLRRMMVIEAKRDLVETAVAPFRLAFPYRGQIFTIVDRALTICKIRMFHSLGIDVLDALSNGVRDPWVDSTGREGTLELGQASLSILDFIGFKGWYDVNRYRAEGINYEALLTMFRTIHEHKARAFLIFVPESSPYRAQNPSEADFHYRVTLKAELGEAAPEILDYREAMSDVEFVDPNHLNSRGRDRLSKLVAEALARSLEVESH